jgi:outer membrane protein insertion porin family
MNRLLLLSLCLIASISTAQNAAEPEATSAPVATDAPLIQEVDPEAIVEVRVENQRRVEPEAVIRALSQKIGQRFDASRTQDDLRSLWALKYFSDIQLLVQRTPKGIAYVVRVKEKPAVRTVTLEGNDELSKDDFKDTLDIKIWSILDVNQVKKNVKKIQDKYIEKGYFLADVDYKLVESDEGREVDVTFVINEHAKVMVKEINFIGASKLTPEFLKSVLATQEGGYLSFFTSGGTYREEMFQRDVQMIQVAYFDAGHINVRVDKPTVTLSPDKRFITIGIKVEEGEAYSVGKLDFSGDLLTSKEDMHKKMTSKENTVFNRSLLARDIQAITDVYNDSGYAFANITPVTAVNAEAKTIDLTFDVQKGNQVYIERIEIIGNTKTRDKVIRRQLRVFEGELFNGTGMRVSKDKVTALGYFETVEVTHRPGVDNEHVVVQVEVKEKSTGTFQVGLGFSNVESFIFTAQIAQQNFLGWGQSVSASVQASGLRQFFQASFFDPYFLDTNNIFSLDAYRTQLSYFGFTRTATGGSTSLGRYLVADEMSVSLGYTFENVLVDSGAGGNAAPLAYTFRSGNTSSLRASWTYDRRNNRLFPTQGSLSFASLEVAPDFLGGSYNFLRYTGYHRMYFPLPFGAVFKFNLQAGYIQDLGAGANQLPISEMYYLGGIQSVRGYPIRTITTSSLAVASQTPDGVPSPYEIGGDKQIYLNVELEIPLIQKVGIRGVLFYDAGNVFGVNRQFFEHEPDIFNRNIKLPLGLYHSVGFGVRWFSPIGPLRFEWGIPLIKRVRPPGTTQDQAVQFEFTIGNSF